MISWTHADPLGSLLGWGRQAGGFLRDFAGDLPAGKAKVLYAVQEPFQKALLTGKTTHAAWRSKPRYYAVSTEDRTINPDLERFMDRYRWQHRSVMVRVVDFTPTSMGRCTRLVSTFMLMTWSPQRGFIWLRRWT